MKTFIVVLCTMIFTATGVSGEVYKIPFASKENSVELTVENGSPGMARGVKVTTADTPAWLHWSVKELAIDELKPNSGKAALFNFSLDKSAPVNKEQLLKFTISASTGETWTKQISITVAPPDHFELYQNFPNPFNPTTTISYLLPYSSQVDIRIYNILGEEVANLTNGEREVGYHEELWNASNVPSGLFFSQLIYTDQKGARHFERKKMLLLK